MFKRWMLMKKVSHSGTMKVSKPNTMSLLLFLRTLSKSISNAAKNIM